MRIRHARTMMAFLAAAAAAALLPALLACAGNLAVSGSCDVDFAFWLLPALASTLAASLLIALPLYLVLRRLGWLGWWQAGIGGGTVGLLAAIALTTLDGGSGWAWHVLARISVPLGIMSGLLFWYIAIRPGTCTAADHIITLSRTD